MPRPFQPGDTLRVRIYTDGAAFRADLVGESARQLARIGSELQHGHQPPFALQDSDGNNCGFVRIDPRGTGK